MVTPNVGETPLTNSREVGHGGVTIITSMVEEMPLIPQV